MIHNFLPELLLKSVSFTDSCTKEHLELCARNSLARFGHFGRCSHSEHILVQGANLLLQGGSLQYLTIGTGLTSFVWTAELTETPT